MNRLKFLDGAFNEEWVVPQELRHQIIFFNGNPRLRSSPNILERQQASGQHFRKKQTVGTARKVGTHQLTERYVGESRHWSKKDGEVYVASVGERDAAQTRIGLELILFQICSHSSQLCRCSRASMLCPRERVNRLIIAWMRSDHDNLHYQPTTHPSLRGSDPP